MRVKITTIVFLCLISIWSSQSCAGTENDGDLKKLTEKANAGDYEAMLRLSDMEWAGIGAAQNPAEAKHWADKALNIMLEKANTQKDTHAMFILGNTYFNGTRAIPKNPEGGIDWYNKASFLGDLNAKSELSAIYCVDERYHDKEKLISLNAEMVHLYTAKAEKGDTEAMRWLSRNYSHNLCRLHGLISTGKDTKKAFAWAEKAAALGSVPALNDLARLYEGETDLDEDYPFRDCKKSYDLYQKAATLGDKIAKERLQARSEGDWGFGCDF